MESSKLKLDDDADLEPNIEKGEYREFSNARAIARHGNQADTTLTKQRPPQNICLSAESSRQMAIEEEIELSPL